MVSIDELEAKQSDQDCLTVAKYQFVMRNETTKCVDIIRKITWASCHHAYSLIQFLYSGATNRDCQKLLYATGLIIPWLYLLLPFLTISESCCYPHQTVLGWNFKALFAMVSYSAFYFTLNHFRYVFEPWSSWLPILVVKILSHRPIQTKFIEIKL